MHSPRRDTAWKHASLRYRSYIWGLGVIVFASAIVAEQNDTRPTVTRKESALLSLVSEVSRTNVAAAAGLLVGELSSESSASLDFTLGNLRFEMDAVGPAVSSYRLALEKAPRFLAARKNLARALLVDEQPATAAEVCREGVRMGQGDDADLLTLLGHACLAAGDSVSGESAFRRALLLSGTSGAKIGLAHCLALQERHREVVALVEEILRREPFRADLWRLRVRSLMAMDSPAEAAVAAETAIALGVGDGQLLAVAGDLHINADRSVLAIERYESALAAGGMERSRLLRAAEVAIAGGQEALAESLCSLAEDALKVDSAGADADADRSTLLRIRGRLAESRGDAAAARQAYEAALSIMPLDGELLLRMGDLARAADLLEEAQVWYERAGRRSGWESRSLVRRAQVEVERSRYASAVRLLEAATVFGETEGLSRYLAQVRRLVR